jgi:hypothetical protein
MERDCILILFFSTDNLWGKSWGNFACNDESIDFHNIAIGEVYLLVSNPIWRWLIFHYASDGFIVKGEGSLKLLVGMKITRLQILTL